MTTTDIGIQRVAAPFDWDAIDAAIVDVGGIILEGFISADEVLQLNDEIDPFLASAGIAPPDTGSDVYDRFLGLNTIRLHGLMTKFPAAIELIGHVDVLDWVDRTLAPMATSQLMNAAELIEIGPDEPAQFFHRDNDSWPQVPRGEHPTIVNAIIALTPFTKENGATNIFRGSHRWDDDRRGHVEDAVQAEMNPGDGVFFRGDLLHGGGANVTTDEHRRGISLSYCVGWLRTVENSFLNLPLDLVRELPPRLRAYLGYEAHDEGGLIGLYENGDPANVLALDNEA